MNRICGKPRKLPISVNCPECGSISRTWKRIEGYGCGCISLGCKSRPEFGKTIKEAIETWNAACENAKYKEFSR